MKNINNHPSTRSWTKIHIGVFVLFVVSPDLKAQETETVFKDFNAKGTRENSAIFDEPGIAGVVVEATKPDGTFITVSYISGGAATQNLAANYPADYCQSDPCLVTPGYINVRPDATTNLNADVLVKYPYSLFGSTQPTRETALAKARQIGSTWGGL